MSVMNTVIKNRLLGKHFTKVSNEMIRNKKISNDAFRVFCLIMSDHDDFAPTYTNICQRLNITEYKLREAIKCLCNEGYYSRIRNNSGGYDIKLQWFHDRSTGKKGDTSTGKKGDTSPGKKGDTTNQDQVRRVLPGKQSNIYNKSVVKILETEGKPPIKENN